MVKMYLFMGYTSRKSNRNKQKDEAKFTQGTVRTYYPGNVDTLLIWNTY